jgi:hypothetical protein
MAIEWMPITREKLGYLKALPNFLAIGDEDLNILCFWEDMFYVTPQLYPSYNDENFLEVYTHYCVINKPILKEQHVTFSE